MILQPTPKHQENFCNQPSSQDKNNNKSAIFALLEYNTKSRAFEAPQGAEKAVFRITDPQTPQSALETVSKFNFEYDEKNVGKYNPSKYLRRQKGFDIEKALQRQHRTQNEQRKERFKLQDTAKKY